MTYTSRAFQGGRLRHIQNGADSLKTNTGIMTQRLHDAKLLISDGFMKDKATQEHLIK